MSVITVCPVLNCLFLWMYRTCCTSTVEFISFYFVEFLLVVLESVSLITLQYPSKSRSLDHIFPYNVSHMILCPHILASYPMEPRCSFRILLNLVTNTKQPEVLCEVKSVYILDLRRAGKESLRVSSFLSTLYRVGHHRHFLPASSLLL